MPKNTTRTWLIFRQYASTLRQPLVCSLIAGLLLWTPHEADARPESKNPNKLRSIEATQQMGTIEQGIVAIQGNYERRGKVLGQTDAELRFNEAVTDYLLGNYKAAAEQFYVLLETESIYGAGFVQEAEWYLVDSAFRIEQYALVEEFAKQISNNPGHMFFTDAIRLLLESHGRRGRSDKFREDYRRFVLSGYVESSDALNYAIGKSLYFQGDTAQAKQALFEIQQDSPFWYRAQYFLGGIYVFEENLAKASQSFDMSYNPQASTDDEIELNHLSLLAKARVLSEQNEYLTAISFYDQVPYSSPYFFDRLYETAWAFIEQERWQEAIDVIQTFLLAYPEDENAIRFRNTLGDLYMQVQDYETALEAYSAVIAQMEPVRERLVQIMTQEPLVLELLDAKLNGQSEPLDYGVPAYIQDRLYKDPELEKTAELVSLAREQRGDVKNAQGYINEIDAVLQNPNRNLYSFIKDQQQLNEYNQQMLMLLLDSLENEVQILLSSTKDKDNGTTQLSLLRIQEDIKAVREAFVADQLSLEQAKQPLDVEADQVVVALQKIKQDARDVRMMTSVTLRELEAFLEVHETHIQSLPAYEQESLLLMVQQVEADMARNEQSVNRLISEEAEALLRDYLGDEQYFKDMLGAVQKDASTTQAEADQVLKTANHFLDDNAVHLAQMPEEQLNELKVQLQTIQNNLKDTSQELESIASDTLRNVMLAKMGFGNAVEDSLDSYLLAFQQIHNQMLPLWTKSSLKDKTVVQQEIDALWIKARKLDATREDVLASMDAIQTRQRVILGEMLREQEEGLNQFADTVVVLAEDAEQLGYQAAYRSFENATDHVEERMLGAELGGVKVTWIRSTNIDEEIERLSLEESTKMSALNKRFEIIKTKLSDSLVQD